MNLLRLIRLLPMFAIVSLVFAGLTQALAQGNLKSGIRR